MDRIVIYTGPKTGFDKILDELDDYKTFSEAVMLNDLQKKTVHHSTEKITSEDIPPEYYENLVAFSHSYAGITSGAVENFLGLIGSFEIDNLFLQNPPDSIRKSIKEAFGSLVESIDFPYRSVSDDVFLEVHDQFEDKIIGQHSAFEALLLALYRLLKSKDKKPAVIMLYGVSGVGKTETAKFISETLEQTLFRKQFSMFQNESYADYIFGGTVQESCLAKELLERKSNVILFDEFDKPAPVFYSAFYQMFDEGVFVDKNYTVNLEKSVIFCTSNFLSEDEARTRLGDPLFYRFDAMIKYGKLTTSDMKRVIDELFQEDSVTQSELSCQEMDCMKELFHNNAWRFENVRVLKKSLERSIIKMEMKKYLTKLKEI